MLQTVQKVETTKEVLAARFGHTMVSGNYNHYLLVGKDKLILFGGAIGDTNKYTITGDTYVLDAKTFAWKKLLCGGIPPTPRAAHACAMVYTFQMVVYGGAAGGGFDINV